MQCLILAGGLGTRIGEFAGDGPKALVPVAGRPFAEHQLRWLASAGVGRVVYATGHRAAALRAFVGDGSTWGLQVAWSDDGERLMGTAGAVRLAVDRGLLDAGFLVLYGDSYLPMDLRPVWRASGRGARALMTVHRNRGRWDASNAVVAHGRVTLFEKGRADAAAIGMDHIDYGVSVLTRTLVTERVPAGEPADLADLYHRLSLEGALHAFPVRERFYEVGSPQGVRDLERHLAGRED